MHGHASHFAAWCAWFCCVITLLSPIASGQDRTLPDAAELAAYDALIKQSDRDHWAFRPLRRPEVPQVNDVGWVRNPIDNFVLAGLEARGWRPSARAASRALLRRVYLDLVGIPPTPEEQAAFVQQADHAVESGEDPLNRVVSDLLSRSAYGERWARHWLDLVRYADSNGYEVDGEKAYVWRYRDWVIQSLNQDKPFNRFIVEQLAGDELPDASAETLIATGYYRLGPWDQEPADAQQDRFDQLDDIVSTTSEVFMGLSLGCARCHNHKFDPLTMLDYYRLVAIFNGLQRPEKGSTGFDHAELDLPLGSPRELEALSERDRAIRALTNQIAAAKAQFRSEFLAAGRSQVPAEALAAISKDRSIRSDAEEKLAAKFDPQLNKELAEALPMEIREQIAKWEKAQTDLQKAIPDLPRGYFMHEPGLTPPPTHLLIRGKAARPGPEVSPGFPAVLAAVQPAFLPAGPRTSRRRLTFADWIADSQNPLTSRVIVNRVWQYHFGEGLVRTPSDFGINGDRPTHKELLDWLADWFVSEGWSLKKLHRLIIDSNTYRMNKACNSEYDSDDSDNRQLWHVAYKRLDVEAIRDSILSVSGRLNSSMYGPAMYPFVSQEALAGHPDQAKTWPAFNEEQASRRTVYAFVKRSLIVPMIEVLDFCDPSRSTPRRTVTNVAPQALSLLNGEFVNRQAQFFAERLWHEAGPEMERQVERAYVLALCRPPSPEELACLVRFLNEEAARLVTDSPGDGRSLAPETAHRVALEQMCRAIFNLNEFVYAD
jgi:hypothetical protein